MEDVSQHDGIATAVGDGQGYGVTRDNGNARPCLDQRRQLGQRHAPHTRAWFHTREMEVRPAHAQTPRQIAGTTPYVKHPLRSAQVDAG